MSEEVHVSPFRPYLVRALYDWMLENRLTPHITVNVNVPGVQLPLQYAQNGMIVLNISPSAVKGLTIDNDAISFCARFGGVPHDVYVPMYAVATVYPREDVSLGLCMFPEKAYDELDKDGETEPTHTHLQAVDDGQNNNASEDNNSDCGLKVVDMNSSAVKKDSSSDNNEPKPPVPPAGGRKKPTLEIVE